MKVTQTAVDKTAREAVDSAHTAREVLEEAEDRLKKGIQPIVVPTSEEVVATKTRVQYEPGRFHFAVAGVAGSGKSPFVNAICGVNTQHAEIGRYSDPNPALPFAWYNIPGAGTPQQPDWLYFNTQGLSVFDCVSVLFDDRFTQMDIAILTNCMRFQISTYIVRSKADVHIRNITYEEGYNSDRDDAPVRESLFPSARRRFIASMRTNLKENLKEGGLPDQRVYIVSNNILLSNVKDRSPTESLTSWN
ncbi:hypothetical protein PISMIDRAFT_19657 [Pisolithus microcarpus 441]|uniref:IRG-type G domain-containing protein n=1 Tax=Pisolithus microcarpus 441 TaxID=765257 RepID=A0A0C9YTS4_9AGAM|nr:hypothetical protein PISMIDRAFT_19657 [Pisolithus microcarpus 441]